MAECLPLGQHVSCITFRVIVVRSLMTDFRIFVSLIGALASYSDNWARIQT